VRVTVPDGGLKLLQVRAASLPSAAKPTATPDGSALRLCSWLAEAATGCAPLLWPLLTCLNLSMH
jgi:hypothetical protein